MRVYRAHDPLISRHAQHGRTQGVDVTARELARLYLHAYRNPHVLEKLAHREAFERELGIVSAQQQQQQGQGEGSPHAPAQG